VLVTIFLLIATISFAFDRFAESLFPDGAIRILGTPVTGPRTVDVLSPETVELIRSTPRVAAVNEQYRALPSVLFQGRIVPLIALSANVVAARGYIPSVGRPSADLARDLQRGGIAVSTGFAKTFKVGVGDTVDLDTRSGAKRFSVSGVFEDFGDASGSIMVDLSTYDASWDRAGASSVIVWFDGPPEPTISEIRRRVGDRQDLFFVDGREAAVATRRYAEVFTSTLHVLGTFLSSLGGIGVMILLAGIVADRRRDLALLRAAGAEPSQLVAVVLLDACILGIVGSACGVALGMACAAPAVDILREYYGWILEQHWLAPQLPFLVLGGVASAILGAALPASMAYRIGADDVFGPE
jgi:putative ABC transport system permease protein